MYVTNGIMHAKKLTQKGCKVYLIGGELKEATLALVGEEAMKTLGRYHFTKGFFGTNGIHIESGCTTPDIREAAIKEMAILRSAKAYILADSTKFGQVAPVTFQNWMQWTSLQQSLRMLHLTNIKILWRLQNNDLHSDI